MGAVVRQVSSADEEQIWELHRRHYWRTNCLLLNRQFYDWQFVDAPSCGNRDHSIVAVDSQGLVLSYLGVTPMALLSHGALVNAAHLISWLSLPEARGKGIGRSMMAHATAQYDFLFGRSVTQAALAVYRKFGFRYFGSCLRWLLILDSEQCLSLAITPDNKTARRLVARQAESFDCEFMVSKDVPSGAGALCHNLMADAVAFERSYEYLVWRYVRHPELRYLFIVVGSKEQPLGISVVRVEDVRDRPGRVLRVVDFLAQGHASLLLAKAVCRFGKDQHCAFLDVFGMSERFVWGLVSTGAFQWHEEESIRLPYLLQPWDPTVEPPGLLFYATKHFWGGTAIDDVTALYISKGDGNMDWPSWVPNEPSTNVST